MAHRSRNLLDWVEAVINQRSGSRRLCPRVSYRDRDRDAFLTSRDGAVSLEELKEAADPVALERLSPTAAGGRVEIDLPDEMIASAGLALEEGGEDPFDLREVAAGERWLVNFGNPNTTKALHIGHLRNIATGQAIASMAAAAGAEVVRQSKVGDFGRNMGEAMAGYLEFVEEGEGTAVGPGDEKGDHFVGRHYARYISRNGQPRTSAETDIAEANPELARECHVYEDRAEALISACMAGDAGERELFERVRGWAMEGHAGTMARLGIAIDRTLCESEYAADNEELLRRGLADGAFERVESGAVLFFTGRDEFPFLLLSRSDGFPTQHLRYIATWWAISPQCADQHTVAVMGEEWGPLSQCTTRILELLGQTGEVHPAQNVLHGMVTSGKDVVRSSRGEVLLVDQILDRLLESPALAAFCSRHDRCDREALAAALALSLVLQHPTDKRIELSLEAATDPDSNYGWALADAWSKAWHPRYDGAADPDPDDRQYRRLVMRSQLLRRTLRRGLDQMEPAALLRFLQHASSWFTALEPEPRTARGMRTLLSEGFLALGLPSSSPIETDSAPAARGQAIVTGPQ